MKKGFYTILILTLLTFANAHGQRPVIEETFDAVNGGKIVSPVNFNMANPTQGNDTTMPLSYPNSLIINRESAGLSGSNKGIGYTVPGANSINLMANSSVEVEPQNIEKSGKATSTQHTMVAPQGWIGLSSYIIPDNLNIDNLFLPVQNQLIILYNQQGIYYPSQQINTLVNWNAQSGYIAKFAQETSIDFFGQTNQNRTIGLTAGWNLVPVLSSCPVNIETLFANASVVVVKEVAGWNLYWPGMGIHTLNEFLPGSAYYVLMNSPANITFPDCGAPVWQCGEALVDTRDGQSYTTVQVGTQCWMAENLNVGTKIPGTTEMGNNNIIEKYCYNNDEANCDVYGGLYKWDEMMQYSITPGVQGLCPAGWHLPSDTEWTTLTGFLGPTSIVGGKMKATGTIEAGTGLWYAPNGGATNSSGFTALPGGNRNNDGTFYALGSNALLWSSTESQDIAAWALGLYNDGAPVYSGGYYKYYGFSVRCVNDTPMTVWSCGQPLPDTRDDKTYNTVQIGTQCWMAENLNTGAMIPGTTDMTDNNIPEKYCYGNNLANCDVYGGLYNWDEMMDYSTTPGVQGLCPAGWHIPEDAEWAVLSDFLGGDNVAGGKMKEAGTLHWIAPNTDATNESGFTALPGGGLSPNGNFGSLGGGAFFWSSIENNLNNYGWSWKLFWEDPIVYHVDDNKGYGFSVRCVQGEYINQPPSLPSTPQPSDGAMNQPVNTMLSWTCTDPENDVLTYDVYFGTTNPPAQVSTGQSGETFDPGVLGFSTSYYWKIVAHDNYVDNYVNKTEGPVWSFTTTAPQTFICGNPLLDTRDNQTYNTVQIGSQCWMAENLNVGAMIPGNNYMSDDGVTEKYCYDNNETNCDTYGGLYQWPEMMQYSTTPGEQGICPTGWHLPADTEWTLLTTFLGGESIAGGKMKTTGTIEAGTGLWHDPNTGATNSSGFTALPGGMNYYNSFFAMGYDTYFWSSTQSSSYYAWYQLLDYYAANVLSSSDYEYNGLSVRCVREIPPAWSCGQPLPDPRDNQTYNTVQIGTQCWMAENLNFGTMVTGTTEMTDNSIIEKYCYDDSPANCNTYGGLYQWSEMMQYSTAPGVQGLCPTGWYLPADEEWTVLTDYLGGEVSAGGKMKTTGTIEAGTGLWYAPNGGATNESGFTALPAGIRSYYGYFYYQGYYAFFWSSTAADEYYTLLRQMDYYNDGVTRSAENKGNGFSVRCVREILPPAWSCGNPMNDTRDNQTYNTVQIGNQCWMAENLNVGAMIPGNTSMENNSITEKYCYNNSTANCDVYGGLYQWNEMMQYSTTAGVQGLCPAGWHLPIDEEWTILTTFLGGESIAGGVMKSTGTIEAGTGLWYDPNGGATNESGFSALPGGIRFFDGSFDYLGYTEIFSSSTDFDANYHWGRYLSSDFPQIFSSSYYNKNEGYSVRCLKD